MAVLSAAQLKQNNVANLNHVELLQLLNCLSSYILYLHMYLHWVSHGKIKHTSSTEQIMCQIENIHNTHFRNFSANAEKLVCHSCK